MIMPVNYDNAYSESSELFGNEPESILIKYHDMISRVYPIVLDIGAGQGRNSYFLAKKGFELNSIDPSSKAIEQISINSELFDNINAYNCDFQDFEPIKKPFGAILIFGLLQILSREQISKLICKIGNWSTEGTLLFITAFATGDPSFLKISKNWNKIDRNCYSDNNGNFRTFFEPDEILQLFDYKELIYNWSGMGALHRHGNSPEHQHSLIQIVLKL